MSFRVPTVSVVIATYNMGQFLGQCIESVLAQTFSDFDVHVVDDGSTDNTPDVVGRFGGDPRLHYHRQENAGQTRAKNVGIARSRGQFVAFCDADDLWKPNKLNLQLPLFGSRPEVGVVYGRTSRLLPDGSEVESNPVAFHEGNITNRLFLSNFIPFGTALVRRSCFEKLGTFDERYRMGIDWELWLRLSTQYQFRYVDEITYVYRIWAGQMSTNWRGRYDHCFRIMSDFVERFPHALPESSIREAYADSYVGRGRARAELGGEYLNACRDAVRSARYRLIYPPAWKLLMRIALLSVGLSKPRPY